MKRTMLIVLPLAVIGLVSTLLYMNSETRRELDGVRSDNLYLSTKLADTENALKKYDGIEKSALLEVCSKKAADDYSEYIRKNSISTQSGNVTTLYPKSPDVIDKATSQRAKAEKDCQARFAS